MGLGYIIGLKYYAADYLCGFGTRMVGNYPLMNLIWGCDIIAFERPQYHADD